MNTAETLDMLIHRALSGGDDATRLALTAVRDVHTAEQQSEIKCLTTERDRALSARDFAVAVWENEQSIKVADLTRERDALARWKQEHLTVESWWARIDAHVRARADITIGSIVADKALELISERDAAIQLAGLHEKEAVDQLMECDYAAIEIAGLKALLRAVTCSEFEGTHCEDVDGRNWWDARADALSK